MKVDGCDIPSDVLRWQEEADHKTRIARYVHGLVSGVRNARVYIYSTAIGTGAGAVGTAISSRGCLRFLSMHCPTRQHGGPLSVVLCYLCCWFWCGSW
jgi:hypothetical protein